MDTFDDVVAAGFVKVTTLSVVCLCSPAERHAPGWGAGAGAVVSGRHTSSASDIRGMGGGRGSADARPIEAMASTKNKPSAIKPKLPAPHRSACVQAAGSAAAHTTLLCRGGAVLCGARAACAGVLGWLCGSADLRRHCSVVMMAERSVSING